MATDFVDILYILTQNMKYIEDITRLREDMDFMFEWQEQYLTIIYGHFEYS